MALAILSQTFDELEIGPEGCEFDRLPPRHQPSFRLSQGRLPEGAGGGSPWPFVRQPSDPASSRTAAGSARGARHNRRGLRFATTTERCNGKPHGWWD